MPAQATTNAKKVAAKLQTAKKVAAQLQTDPAKGNQIPMDPDASVASLQKAVLAFVKTFRDVITLDILVL
eukprot:5918794-Pyramimonas_sp.AAC.1